MTDFQKKIVLVSVSWSLYLKVLSYSAMQNFNFRCTCLLVSAMTLLGARKCIWIWPVISPPHLVTHLILTSREIMETERRTRMKLQDFQAKAKIFSLCLISLFVLFIFPFCALLLLVGQEEGHLPCKEPSGILQKLLSSPIGIWCNLK